MSKEPQPTKADELESLILSWTRAIGTNDKSLVNFAGGNLKAFIDRHEFVEKATEGKSGDSSPPPRKRKPSS